MAWALLWPCCKQWGNRAAHLCVGVLERVTQTYLLVCWCCCGRVVTSAVGVVQKGNTVFPVCLLWYTKCDRILDMPGSVDMNV